MLKIENENLEENYVGAIHEIRRVGVLSPSRAGEVLVAPYPVIAVYRNPMERVLLDPQRRANPFFHLMEALWMLYGTRDARWLDTYVGDFSKRFAESNGLQHGAYGARWRGWFDIDQLNYTVNALSDNMNDRRVVIAMWDVSSDLGYTNKKDLPCNTHIYPRIVNGKLDLTVCCRSNDIIWGAYGANAVHFSVLQEYLAGRIGVGIGRLYQLSNNWHAYTDVLDKVAPPQYYPLCDHYSSGQVAALPMGNQWNRWDQDLFTFMKWHNELWSGESHPGSLHIFLNKWFQDVAVPMVLTWWAHKQKSNKINPLLEAAEIKASDWRAAAIMWLKTANVKEAETANET